MKTFTELLEIVESQLLARLDAGGGTIDKAAVEAILSPLKQQAHEQETHHQRSPLSGLEYHFEAILAKRFIHLFANPESRSLKEGALSIRVLPGFFKVVRMMIGADRYKMYCERCQAIANDVLQEQPNLSGSQLVGTLCRHPETRRIAMLVYARIGIWFTQFTKRKTWLISIINGSLGPTPIPPNDPDEENWKFTEAHFTELFTVLFLEDVIVSLLDPTQTQLLIDEFGPKSVEKLKSMMASLNADMDLYFGG